MLCRSEKSFKVSGIGHSIKRLKTIKMYGRADRCYLNCNTKTARLAAFFIAFVVMIFSGAAYSQNTSNLYNPGQSKIDAQLKTWLANTEHVGEANITVSMLDYRLKIQDCERPISFDFPFASHKTVRAKCDAPAWQYYLQASVVQPSSGTPPTASAQAKPPQTTPETLSPNPNSSAIQTSSALAKSNPTDQQTQVAPKLTTPATNSGVHTVLTSPQFLKRGTILEPNMFIGTEVALQPGDMSALSNPKDVVNMELLRDLPANTPLKSFDLKPMVMIKRGQLVIVSVGEGKGFLISIRAESLQDGQLGDQIRLKNTESGRSISAVVTGVNTAKAM